MMDFKIYSGDPLCGKTILSVLKGMSLSSRMIKYLKYRDDGIVVNGERVTVRYTLQENDLLSLALNDSVSADCLPTDTYIDVIFENDDLIVVNKPPFMPTHTSHGHYDDTLANALAGYFLKKEFPFVFRPINRLDRNTSGLVLVAKNKHSASFLSKAMREKEIKKTVMNIVTDCKGLEEPKDPDSCNVFALYKLFATEEEIAEMRQNYLGGNYGYGHAKKALFDKMWSFFEPMRKRRAELEADPGYVEEILRKNGEIARAEAMKLMEKVRKAVGL